MHACLRDALDHGTAALSPANCCEAQRVRVVIIDVGHKNCKMKPEQKLARGLASQAYSAHASRDRKESWRSPRGQSFGVAQAAPFAKTQAALRTYRAQHSCLALPAAPLAVPLLSSRGRRVRRRAALPLSGGCSSHRLRAPPKPAALRYTALRRTAYTPRAPEQPCVPKQETPPGGRPGPEDGRLVSRT